MLNVLEEEAPEKTEPEKAAPEKKEKKTEPKAKKAEPEKAEPKKKAEPKTQPVKSEKTRAQIFAEIFNENVPRTMNELIDEMTKRYHSDSVAGSRTFVSIYVSILKEVGLLEKNEKNQYTKSA